MKCHWAAQIRRRWTITDNAASITFDKAAYSVEETDGSGRLDYTWTALRYVG